MATNLNIDDKLIKKAKRLGKHKTKKDAVNAALDSYVRRLMLDELFSLAGKIDYYPDYDYKAARYRKHGSRRHAGVVGDLPSSATRSGRARARQAA
jgi:hypothetical protein